MSTFFFFLTFWYECISLTLEAPVPLVSPPKRIGMDRQPTPQPTSAVRQKAPRGAVARSLARITTNTTGPGVPARFSPFTRLGRKCSDFLVFFSLETLKKHVVCHRHTELRALLYSPPKHIPSNAFLPLNHICVWVWHLSRLLSPGVSHVVLSGRLRKCFPFTASTCACSSCYLVCFSVATAQPYHPPLC